MHEAQSFVPIGGDKAIHSNHVSQLVAVQHENLKRENCD